MLKLNEKYCTMKNAGVQLDNYINSAFSEY